jgi:hypothetical protein
MCIWCNTWAITILSQNIYNNRFDHNGCQLSTEVFSLKTRFFSCKV